MLPPFRFTPDFSRLPPDVREALNRFAANVRDAFSPVLSWAPLDSIELQVDFESGSTTSSSLSHKLGIKPNRVIVTWGGSTTQTIRVSSWDERSVTFQRSSSTGDRTFFVRLYREPGGDVELT